MSEINPLVAAILPSAQQQRAESTERADSVRRAQDLKKKSTQHEDIFVHEVESADAISPVHEDGTHHDHRKKRTPHVASDDEDQTPRIDVTA